MALNPCDPKMKLRRSANNMIATWYLLMAIFWFALAMYHDLTKSGNAHIELLIALCFVIAYEAREIRLAIAKKRLGL